MVFKLVRTDTEEPFKIQLPLGTHMIGRGKFLECDDKRVSRNHGELQVTDDSVTIKALHQNPCFYIKKGMEQTEILKRDCMADLCNGDKFGLLPDSYWYEILHFTSTDISREFEVKDSQETVVEKTTLLNDNSTQNALDEENENVGVAESPSLIQRSESPSLVQRSDSPSLVQRDKSPSLVQRNESPSLNQSSESQSLIQRPESPSLTPRDSPVNPPVTDQSPTQEYRSDRADQPEEPKSPSKRPHSPQEAVDVKRVKTEPVEVKQEPAVEVKQEPAVEVKQEPAVDVKQELDAAPGPSGDQAGSSSADKDKDCKPAAPAPTLGRERCMYGANCYRKNPQHKAQFSHPTDSDWGAGPRGLCPWGAACARRDARHWRDHDHPPGAGAGVQRPQRPDNRPVQRKKKRSDSDDNTPDQDLIVTGKRARSQKQRLDDLSGSESDDPYQTDGSDEWQPDSSMGTSDYTQTQDID